MQYIWIFNGENSRFCSGVFTTVEKAEAWIGHHRLSGILTQYPVDTGVYDWAIRNGYFSAKKEEQLQPAFIGKFTTASQEHYHYENGIRA